VREQLPWYDMVSSLVSTVCRHYLPEDGTIYDIGSSTGNMAVVLEDAIKDRNVSYIGIDNSEQMIRNVRASVGSFVCANAQDYKYKPFDVGICFLILMFIPVKERMKLLNDLYYSLNEGGAIVVVDKFEDEGGNLSQAVYRDLLIQKIRNGASPEEVLKKEYALSGIQRPLHKGFFDGFPSKMIFKFGCFEAWVIEKPINS
jgi:tRNA (cmo5U34)-methyltransferase